MKVLVVLVFLVAFCAAQPPRPKPPETFYSDVRIARHLQRPISFGNCRRVRRFSILSLCYSAVYDRKAHKCDHLRYGWVSTDTLTRVCRVPHKDASTWNFSGPFNNMHSLQPTVHAAEQAARLTSSLDCDPIPCLFLPACRLHCSWCRQSNGRGELHLHERRDGIRFAALWSGWVDVLLAETCLCWYPSHSGMGLPKVREGVSGQAYTRATISTHHIVSSFPLVVVHGWDDSRCKGPLFHHISSPRVVTCGRASRFSCQMLQEGVSEHRLHFACTRRSSNWNCLAKPLIPVLTRE